MISQRPMDTNPSARLIQVLRTYCTGLDQTSIADLPASIHAGRYPWFRHEFETAIRERVFTTDTWTYAVGNATTDH